MNKKELKNLNQLLASGKADKALQLAVGLLEESPPELVSQSDLLDIACETYNRCGNYQLSIDLYNLILDRCCDDGDRWLEIRALDGLAKCHYYIGDYPRSIQYLEQAREKDEHQSYKVYFLGNTARIHIKLGKFEKAAEMLKQALDASAYNGSELSACRNRMSLAYCYALQGNHGSALELMNEIDLNLLADYPFDHSVFYEYKGYMLYLKAGQEESNNGLLDQALETLKKGLEIAYDFSPEGTCAGQIQRMIAEIFLWKKEYSTAEQYAREAFRISTRINERYELGILHWIFALIAEYNKDPERARFSIQTSEKILSDIDADYEIQRLHEFSPLMQTA